MKKLENPPDDSDEMRERIIGLGDRSIRKSYYPELQERLSDLERFKTLLDQSNDAIFLIDVPSGCLLYMSKSACTQIGYSEDECYSLTMYNLFPESTEKLKLIISGKTDSFIFDTVLQKGSGNKTPYELNMHKVTFNNRLYVVAIARDITERKRAEEALRESEEKFRALTESSAAGIVVYQGEWLVSVNPAAERITGYSRDELLRMRTIDIIHPEFKELVKKRALARQLGEPEPSQYETEIVTKSGEVKWVLLSVGVMMYRGKRAGVATLLDITDHKTAEEALRVSETKYRIVADNTYDWEFWESPEGRYIYASPSCERITGYKVGDFAADPDLMSKIVHSSDQLLFRRHQQEIKETRTPGSLEFRIVRKDGGVRWIYHVCQPVFDERGRYMGIRGSNRDNTDRKLAEFDREQLLQEIDGERRRLETILESLPVSVFIIDTKGRIVLANPVARNLWGGKFAGTIEELEKNKLRWADSDKPFNMQESGLVRAVREGQTTLNEMIENEVNGVRFTMICSTAPLLDARRNITGAVVICQDITEMRKLETDLAKSKQQAELYLDLMGHDLTNMNQALMGYLELIEIGRETGDIDKNLIRNSIEIINRSSRMITDVKKLTGLLTDQVPLNDVGVGKMLAAVMARYSSVPNRQVTINYTPGEDCIVRAGDLLEDVFDNLVDNAIRHSTGPVNIDVGVDLVIVDGQLFCKVTVSDTGPGIPDDLKKKIFSTLEEAVSKPERRGFGLYLVRTLVDYYHGRVWVEDRVPRDHSKGARFVVELPVAKCCC